MTQLHDAGSVTARSNEIAKIAEVLDAGKAVIIIDGRALDRECLVHGLRSHDIGADVLAFGSIEEWKRVRDRYPPASVIALNFGGRRTTDPETATEISRLAAELDPVPVVILADTDELTQILKALECGARGFIPTSVGIEICVEAIKLATVGGIFVPASSVVAVRNMISSGNQEARPMARIFTQRQEEVIRELRRGKANKIIAYELNLRESTVKVHIRNIMKKLKATNRTEVAYKINQLFPPTSGLEG